MNRINIEKIITDKSKNTRMFNRLYGFYIAIYYSGYQETKNRYYQNNLSRRTFQRYQSELIKMGISKFYLMSLQPSPQSKISSIPVTLKFELDKQVPPYYVEPKNLFDD